MSRFKNNYASDGKQRRAAARAEAGHRCIRCGHPYKCGLKRADKGEWSACDSLCTHKGVIRVFAVDEDDPTSAHFWKTTAEWETGRLVRKGTPVDAQWRILTVHHFDGDKANDAWWNQLALCQVCHLSVQSRVNPEVPWLFEHSEWLKPYVAGFYALKYLGKQLTRSEVMSDLEQLLALENLTAA